MTLFDVPTSDLATNRVASLVMQSHIDNWACSMVVERRTRIDHRPVYQRGPVWTLAQQQRLIDSMLRGYDIPKFYLTRRGSTEPYDHDVTDGQQRLISIWKFFDDGFALGVDSEDVPDYGDLSGLRFSELDEGPRDRIKLFKLTICEITQATDPEVRELFLRLQEGASLNPAEKRNAILGSMRDFVADLGENHPVFGLTRLSNARFGWHNLAAHVVRLELAEGPADVKASDLRAMYEQNANFDRTGPVAQRVRAVLDYMVHILHSKPAAMSIKWGFVDMYLAVSRLMHRSPVNLDGQEKSFLLMFEAFERRRRAVDDPEELLEGSSPEDRQLFRYIDNFVKDAATKASIERRHRVYLFFLAAEIPELAEIPEIAKAGSE